MEYLAAAGVLGLGVIAFRHFTTPSCPRCKARKWDRKLCAPLLFCRRCATRFDQHGRVYN